MKKHWAGEVDAEGRVILPAAIAERFGYKPGSTFIFEEQDHQLTFHIAPTCLRRITIEPTNLCNLDCLTCMRNVWSEPGGRMDDETFQRFLDSLVEFSPLPLVFFGGYGEPLSHPKIMEWLSKVKSLGGRIELITNGTLLDDSNIRELCRIGLDRLWVSIDGATPASYADIRLGEAFPQIIADLEFLKDYKARYGLTLPQLGIAFVAMRRNLADLPELIRLGVGLGADEFSISNVLAHTPELRSEILYEKALDTGHKQSDPGQPLISLPRFDIDATTGPILLGLLSSPYRLKYEGQPMDPGIATCPFAMDGSLALRWDGAISPCPPLLHSHTYILDYHPRQSKTCLVGNIHENTLKEIWLSPAYLDLRKRLQEFDFSPCAYCNSCPMSEQNLEDCLGNLHPACGGCLWAQGLIQCP